VNVGLVFDLDALTSSAGTILRVPLFLLALLLVRGVPAFLYRGLVGNRRTIVAGFLQATSLPFIVAASMIGVELGVIGSATSAALIGAGLLSVLLFPPVAAGILGRSGRPEAAPAPHPRRWARWADERETQRRAGGPAPRAVVGDRGRGGGRPARAGPRRRARG
jgi:hypothetical protein